MLSFLLVLDAPAQFFLVMILQLFDLGKGEGSIRYIDRQESARIAKLASKRDLDGRFMLFRSSVLGMVSVLVYTSAWITLYKCVNHQAIPFCKYHVVSASWPTAVIVQSLQLSAKRYKQHNRFLKRQKRLYRHQDFTAVWSLLGARLMPAVEQQSCVTSMLSWLNWSSSPAAPSGSRLQVF